MQNALTESCAVFTMDALEYPPVKPSPSPRQQKRSFFDGRSDGKVRCPDPTNLAFMRVSWRWKPLSGNSYSLRFARS